MFLKMRKSRGDSEKKSPVQEDDDSEKTEEELRQFSDTVNSSDEDKDEAEIEDVLAQPESEISDRPRKGPEDEEKDLSILLGNADEEEEGEQENEGESDSLSNLFNQDEEVINPLMDLIASLPDVTARELLAEAQEVSAIILEWRQN